MVNETHTSRAAYVPDLSIGLAWGMPYEHGREWQEDGWHNADPIIRGELFLLVDGHRGTIPAGTPVYDHTDPVHPKKTGETITEYDDHLFCMSAGR